MRCDKCRKKFSYNWVVGENYPKYETKEHTGIGEYTIINLCQSCSQLLQEWLTEEPEQNEGFGR